MKYSLLFILVIILYSCQTDKLPNNTIEDGNLEYIFVGRTRHDIDTIFRKIITKEFKDSIYRLSYIQFDENGTFEDKFELPISNTPNIISKLKDTLFGETVLLNKKTVRYKNKEYKVYKYLFDDKDARDEEMLYFFVPEFGIVIYKSAWWGNYDKLVFNGNNEDSDDLFFINEMISFDFEFFHDSKLSTPQNSAP